MTPGQPLRRAGPGDRRPEAPLLAATGLAVRRNGRLLLRPLSFTVWPGELTELRGANGTGKSSLLRVLAGLLPAAAGTLSGPGAPSSWPAPRPAPLPSPSPSSLQAGQAPADAAQADGDDVQPDRAYLGHQNALTPDLTAAENLSLAARLEGVPGSAGALEAALARVGLAGMAQTAARRLSQGQQRRLALARLCLSPRRLWLLDEPLNALDAQGEALFAALLRHHLAQGGAALVATHHPLPLPPDHVLALGAPTEALHAHAAHAA